MQVNVTDTFSYQKYIRVMPHVATLISKKSFRRNTAHLQDFLQIGVRIIFCWYHGGINGTNSIHRRYVVISYSVL